EHRHRHVLGQLHVLGDVGAGDDGLGEPLADVVLPPPGEGPEAVERLPGDDADQVGAGGVHRRLVDRRPPQPRLLDDVLGVRRGPEHLVGDREEQPPVPVEGVGAHVPSLPGTGSRRTPLSAAGRICGLVLMSTSSCVRQEDTGRCPGVTSGGNSLGAPTPRRYVPRPCRSHRCAPSCWTAPILERWPSSTGSWWAARSPTPTTTGSTCGTAPA